MEEDKSASRMIEREKKRKGLTGPSFRAPGPAKRNYANTRLVRKC